MSSTRTDGAKQLAAYLKGRGLPQCRLADAIGVSHPTVHDWLHGARRPRAVHRALIAKWTSDEVAVAAWVTGEEWALIDATQPFETPAF